MPPTRRNAFRLLVLMLALSLVAVALVALACGPAAPGEQDGPPEPTATAEPAGTTDQSTPTPTGGLPDEPPPTPPLTQLQRQYTNLGSNLTDKIAEYEAASGAGGASGSSDQPTPTPELIFIRLFTDTAERVDTVKEFLEDNGAREINCYKGSSEDVIKGECSATAPVSLLRGLAEHPGVLRIAKDYPSVPASNLPSPSSQQTPADAHGAMAWRLAGANGAGVKVGIIDYGFKDFRTRLPNLTPAAKPFCYDTSGNLDKVNISVCETNIGPHPSDDHGTEVAEALTEVAPGVSLYIANAHTLPRIKAANVADANRANRLGIWVRLSAGNDGC